MVDAPEMTVRPIPAGRYLKSTKRSTQQRHQVNDSKSGLEAETVRALGALRSLRSKKTLAAEKRQETHFSSNEEEEKWIDDYVERETAGARKGVEDAQAAIQQQQNDMKHAEIVGLMTREPEMKFEEMMVALGDSLSDLSSSDDGEDREHEHDEETVQGRLREDDEPGLVMGTISEMVQHCIERCQQKQMKLDELAHPWWQHAATYFRERDNNYDRSKWRGPAVVLPETDDDPVAPAPTTFGGLIESVEIVPGQLQMPQGTSRPWSSHIRLGSVKPELNPSISSLELAVEGDTSPLWKAKPVEAVGFCLWIWPPANHHIDFGFGRRHGDGSCVSGGIDRQRVIGDIISWWNAISSPISLLLSFFFISVTKLWYGIICLWMCRGWTHCEKF